MKAIASTAR
jgi:hypothetical protein